MKRILVIVLGVVCCATYLFAQVNCKITASKLNVHIAPSTDARIIGVLYNNDTIVVQRIDYPWAEIIYENQSAYISSKYLIIIGPVQVQKPTIEEDTVTLIQEPTANPMLNTDSTYTVWNKWGIDFLPSLSVGVSGLLGDYSPIPVCALGIQLNFQYYQKYNNSPRGWMAESSLGYSLRGCGAMPIHYFTLNLAPAGYTYTLQNGMTLYGLIGLSFNIGGGSIETKDRIYKAELFDLGLQVKFAVEWRNISFAVSYDQGFLDVMKNSSLSLRNYGVLAHVYYRLWDIPRNKIYYP